LTLDLIQGLTAQDSTLDPEGLNMGRVQCEYSQVVYESGGRGRLDKCAAGVD